MTFTDIEVKQEYRSRLDNVIKDFYIPVLKNAVLYKRAVGFFSSTALVEISAGLCGLVKNGGKIQLVASPRLSEEDINAINDGLRRGDDVIKEALIRELNEPVGKEEAERLNLLSNLIASGILEIRIAFLEDDNMIGMFHEKMGLMYDSEDNIIAFSGSMNESYNAFYRNYEAVDVFTSWSNDFERVLTKQAAFNAIWNDYEPSIRVMEFPEVSNLILSKYRVSNEMDLSLDDGFTEISRVHKDNIEAQKKLENGPYIPLNINMRSYQNEAIINWAQNNYCGIFDMATGTGKTYTALAAVVSLYKAKNQNLAVFIVCPYQHLVEQWKEDIIVFGMKPIVCYSASAQKNWKDRLKTAATGFLLGVQNHFCVVTTNATFSGEYIQTIVKKMKGNVLLVVDEAHNFGADNLSRTLMNNIKYRLALSATIDRQGDPEGTRKLYDYFGEKCIEYTLKDAIDNHMLTPYYYHPIVVSLSKSELEEYIELTNKIRKNVFSSNHEISEYAKMLLIKRARLVSGAVEKISVLRDIMQDFRKDNHMLIYCGATTMHYIDYYESKAHIDEIRQIDLITNMLGNELGMRVSKFTSEEDPNERDRIKKDFDEGDHLQAVVAIRCLDEGVNIPSIKTAFILASSTNPKEYVQRRGRVLRLCKGKNYAVIYDFITLPFALEDINKVDQALIESGKSLAKREVMRIKDFASIAENPFASDELIAQIQSAYNIDFESEDQEEENYVQ